MKLPMVIVGILVGAVLGIAGIVIYPILGLLSPLLGMFIGACAGGVAGVFTLKYSVLSYQRSVEAKSTMCRLDAYFGIFAATIFGGILGLIATFWVLTILYGRMNHVQLLTGIAFGAFLGGFPTVIYVRRYIRELKEIQYAKYLVSLPENAGNLIKSIIGQMRYRKKVQDDVMAELAGHFEDELRDCKTNEEREQKARRLIEDFGDAKLLAVLLRRAKKRCRPLWRTVVARTFQTIGVLILCLALYTTWFLTGKPVISVDYLEIINQMSRPQITDTDNAWPHYEKAFSLLVEPNESLKRMAAFKNYREAVYLQFNKLTTTEQLEIRKWVEQNNAAWQEFAAGSLKPYSYRKVEYNEKDESDKMLWNIILPHLGTLSDLAKAGIWRCRMEIEQGQPHLAVADCLAIVRAGKHLQNNKMSTVEQLVGSSLAGLGCAEIEHIAATQDLSAEDLEQLGQQLTKIYPDGYPLTNLEGEKIMFLDVVQHLFTDGGPGGGHLIPKRFLDFELRTSGVHERPNEHLIVPYTATAMTHIRRDETIDKANEIYDQLNKTIKISPYDRHINRIKTSDEILTELPRYKYSLFHIFLPGSDRVSESELVYRGKTQYEATLTILALQQWQMEKGDYPETLNNLVESGYLKELPMDPFSDQPLVYKRTADNFTLYSVGLNFKDDGGQVYRDEKGKPQLWHDEFGDAVFWPVQKSEVEQ
jgi:gas vesicle protein